MHANNLDIINARLFLLIFREEILPKKCLDLNLHDFHPDTPPPLFVSYEKRFDQNWIFPSTGVCFTKKLIIKLWNYEF